MTPCSRSILYATLWLTCALTSCRSNDRAAGDGGQPPPPASGGQAEASPQVSPDPSHPEPAASPAGGKALPDFCDLFVRASPSVVNISAAHVLPIPEDLLPRHRHEIWRAMAHSLGSGFAIDSAGRVVTCSSVIQDAEDIEVILHSGRHLPARVLAADPASDIALLQIDPAHAPPPLPLAKAPPLQAGDWVAAFGYPYGLAHSISAGMVSAIRPAEVLGSSHGLILSDAAINPGCNGGPLLNTQGQVVGINLVSHTSAQGLGLAIPIDDALGVIAVLKTGRPPRHGWLGASVQYVDAELAASFGLAQAEGALVSRIQDGGPAARAGLQVGDVIVSLGGRPVEDPLALIEGVRRAAVGRPLSLRILRRGKPRLLRVTLTTEAP